MFRNAEESHQHSLETLNQLYEYDDFMESISTVADIGCGDGKDLEWWATRTTRDEQATPLNIKCQGIDLTPTLPIASKYKGMTYQKADFEGLLHPLEGGFDILWCHNSFQYATNPLQTLANWRKIAAPGAMLVLIVPQTTNIYQKDLDFSQEDGCYHHYTIVSLIHMLAVTGWDCKAGFFKKNLNDNWLYAVVYNSSQEPRDPKTTRWYDLVEAKLLPDSADKSVMARGFLHQKDLVLPWLDKSLNYIHL
jgi:SAM-dependent methyltransferase